ncbi:hypothetical protein Bbelb_190250 [Branchiostoma belcheri]|nr:hypothetical protein Bbelb_190250 [Branchiostoma belcheri]
MGASVGTGSHYEGVPLPNVRACGRAVCGGFSAQTGVFLVRLSSIQALTEYYRAAHIYSRLLRAYAAGVGIGAAREEKFLGQWRPCAPRPRDCLPGAPQRAARVSRARAPGNALLVYSSPLGIILVSAGSSSD